MPKGLPPAGCAVATPMLPVTHDWWSAVTDTVSSGRIIIVPLNDGLSHGDIAPVV